MAGDVRRHRPSARAGEMSAADTRVLIVGAAGMLGHKVWEQLRGRYQVWATVRQASAPRLPLFADGHVLTGIDAEDIAALERVCTAVRPETIVNCVGLVK